MNEVQKLEAVIRKKDNQIDELLVVIDTAQAALRRAEATIKEEKDKAHVFNQSAKWVLNFKL
jgi:Tfp pilus assembly protein PilX